MRYNRTGMSDERAHQPFVKLGQVLKSLREARKETLADVSGAVEIDEQTLLGIEQGRERPSEDILLLLINHFDMSDDKADHLWRMAGYEDLPKSDDYKHDHTEAVQQKPIMTLMIVDPRVVYSDGVQVVANGSGVIMNFAQGTNTPQSLVAARIGMSREQAKTVLQALQLALESPKPRQLPSGDSDKK